MPNNVGNSGNVAGSARCNGALVVRGHLQDVPCHLLVALNSLKPVSQHIASRKAMCDVPTHVIATAS